jgi:radical SAM superfamily enzyme YgiQ (UPF0313 family)
MEASDMRALLIWPVFPPTFWSFEGVLEFSQAKALIPPLGLVTVAGLLPDTWDIRILDRNTTTLTEADWEWADMVMLSSMIVQRDDFLATIREAKSPRAARRRGRPLRDSVPEDAEAAGADYIVMDEGEITIPMILEELLADPTWRRGARARPRALHRAQQEARDARHAGRAVRSARLAAYDMMSVQYSRGCPFLCEFCDIINLYGRVPRTKPTEKLLAELQRCTIWAGAGACSGRRQLHRQQEERESAAARAARLAARTRQPFYFDTEASIDLAPTTRCST